MIILPYRSNIHAYTCITFFVAVRKRTVPYDISWNGHLEQNSGKMSSRMPTRLRSSSRYSKADILEEEDDYYDDEEYMDNR